LKRILTKEILQKYYSSYFSLEPLIKVIGISKFQNREFGFLLIDNGNERFIRNMSFKTPSELVKFMALTGVKGAYVGAMYDPPPRPSLSVTKLKWIGRELIFDLDLTDYDDIRTCGKGKDHVCPKCWPLVANAAMFLDETLKDDFGFKKIYWFFSGRRGFHAWVADDITRTFDEEIREAIVSYISPEEHEKSVLPLAYQKRALKIYTKTKLTDTMLRKRFKSEIEKIWSELMNKLPRIDKKVTIDRVRLLRVPGSVHNATGKIVTEVKDLESFYPDDAPDIWSIMV